MFVVVSLAYKVCAGWIFIYFVYLIILHNCTTILEHEFSNEERAEMSLCTLRLLDKIIRKTKEQYS